MASYLICYLGAGNSLTLKERCEVPSMGHAMERAQEIAEEMRSSGIDRVFVLHGYEVKPGDKIW